MRVGLFAIFSVLITEICSIDQNLKERTDDFVKTRLIPALQKAKVTNVDFNRIRLCLCSTEHGCSTRTKGWLPGIGLSDEDKRLYENTCYTDGDCYQNVRPSPEIAHFGCIDASFMNHESEFHDTAGKTCSNLTTGSDENLWNCCSTNHFCANETMLTADTSKDPLSSYVNGPTPTASIRSWVWMILIPVLCVAVIAFAYANKHYTVKMSQYGYNRFMQKPKQDVEMGSTNLEKSGSESDKDNQSLGTMSTTLEEENETLRDIFPVGNPLYDMLKVLVEDSGSGHGPKKLSSLTVGKKCTILNKIGSGGFGNVYKGILQGDIVAVKKFISVKCEESFFNELELYETRMLRHPGVLNYYGSDRIDMMQYTESWLIVEYHENGSLYEFLTKNTVDKYSLFKLIRSACAGLAFLHRETTAIRGVSSKPSIAHRDIKSRNIMVKENLTCAIGDFGLSTCEPVYELVEKKHVYKICGTARYLAPEILNTTFQCAVLDSYLRADMYSFALVMWEVLSRYEDDGISATDEIIPYAESTKRDPSYDEMRLVVNKNRPPINTLWCTNSKLKPVVRAITTCWHGNPTARLTAYNCMLELDKDLISWLLEEKRQLRLPGEKAKMRKQPDPLPLNDVPALKPQPKVEHQRAPENVNYDERLKRDVNSERIENNNFHSHDGSRDPLL